MSFIDRNIQNSNSGDDGSYDFNNCCGDIGHLYYHINIIHLPSIYIAFLST